MRRNRPHGPRGIDRWGSDAADRAKPTDLHEERLDVAIDELLRSGARSVLDLGCGTGGLLTRLVREPQFTRIVGLDASIAVLDEAESALAAADLEGGRVELVHAGFDASAPRLVGFDAAAMVETIEHIDPGRLSFVERVVFGEWRPEVIVLTTPNGDFNPVLGLEDGDRRHPDHRFEWGQYKFRSWSAGVARRNGYHVRCDGIGPPDPIRGSPTHLAVFRRSGTLPDEGRR
jgi:small RNA 2'-O-methyltransferase